MDYTSALDDPSLLVGIKELLSDTDKAVVKRTVRVYSNVFNNALNLLATNEIKEETVIRAWPNLAEINSQILNIFQSHDHEGTLLMAVKFLELSLSKLLSKEILQYKETAKNSREFAKNGLKTLKELVQTPYVGGSVFIIGVKSLIRVACVRIDLHEPVTELVRKLLQSLPPTLFDHNVRSLHKLLQFNLFRLLKRAENDDVKSKLIDMMVTCGANRRGLAAWKPKEILVPKRELPQKMLEDVILGRFSPPNKRQRADEGPSSNRQKVYDITSNIKSKLDEGPNTKHKLNEDPRKRQKVDEGNSNKKQKVDGVPANNVKALVVTSKRKSPEPKDTPIEKIDKSQLSFEDECQRIYNEITLDKICTLIISNTGELPESMPDDFPSKFSNKAVVSEDLKLMKKHIASLIVKETYPNKQFLSKSKDKHNISSKDVARETPLFSNKSEQIIVAPQQSTPPLPVADIDMRRLYFEQSRDVDMRILLPFNNTPCDPRLMRPLPLLPSAEPPPPLLNSPSDNLVKLDNKLPMTSPVPNLTTPVARVDPRLSARVDPRQTNLSARQNNAPVSPMQNNLPVVPDNPPKTRDPRLNRSQELNLTFSPPLNIPYNPYQNLGPVNNVTNHIVKDPRMGYSQNGRMQSNGL